jgi:hypothetical protein
VDQANLALRTTRHCVLSVEFFGVASVGSSEVADPQASQNRHLLLGTVSFTVCFAAWGLISAFAPHFRQLLHLSATQTGFLVAVFVLLGSLARIPMGMLTDRFGGRIVFTVLMFFVAVPVALVPATSGHKNLLIVAFLLGMAGSSFAVGVGYVSRWFSMESQGSARSAVKWHRGADYNKASFLPSGINRRNVPSYLSASHRRTPGRAGALSQVILGA